MTDSHDILREMGRHFGVGKADTIDTSVVLAWLVLGLDTAAVKQKFKHLDNVLAARHSSIIQLITPVTQRDDMIQRSIAVRLLTQALPIVNVEADCLLTEACSDRKRTRLNSSH